VGAGRRGGRAGLGRSGRHRHDLGLPRRVRRAGHGSRGRGGLRQGQPVDHLRLAVPQAPRADEAEHDQGPDQDESDHQDQQQPDHVPHVRPPALLLVQLRQVIGVQRISLFEVVGFLLDLQTLLHVVERVLLFHPRGIRLNTFRFGGTAHRVEDIRPGHRQPHQDAHH
jgi:hypothetical protein